MSMYYQEPFWRTTQLPGPRSHMLKIFTWSKAKRHTTHLEKLSKGKALGSGSESRCNNTYSWLLLLLLMQGCARQAASPYKNAAILISAAERSLSRELYPVFSLQHGRPGQTARDQCSDTSTKKFLVFRRNSQRINPCSLPHLVTGHHGKECTFLKQRDKFPQRPLTR